MILPGLEKTLGRMVDFVLPPRCVVSGAIVDGPGMVAPEVWQSFRFISDPYCACCGTPFDFAAEGRDGALCVACLEKRPPYDRARAALAYDDASREIILRFKHADQTHAARVFIPWLRQAGRELIAPTDVIVPVPLHRYRLLKRRYNQAALLAQALAKDTGLPCLPGALHRHRATPAQGHMDSEARRKNVRGAFAVRPAARAALAGKRVLLVDDVYTTGATVAECAKTLLKADAAAVDVLAVARVVRQG